MYSKIVKQISFFSKENCNISVLRCRNLNTGGQVRFQVLVAACMKMSVFWIAAPCTQVEVYQCFKGVCGVHHQGDDVGGGKHLRKVCKRLIDYTAQKPRSQTFSYRPPREPKIPQIFIC